ncbi:hypothetical protein [Candidatus Aalborgicola defluviihabitans]|uniref:hypothetical protein n=1 Tax=Candidatus Aalborgicola defluviihabitans TaxID=3386187 RepID=UPI001EB5D4CA|nr:hypothetical protein [Burkholderiales bacterium]
MAPCSRTAGESVGGGWLVGRDPYRPPFVVEQAPPPVVIQVPAPVQSQPGPQVAPAPQFWYYCDASRAYYPYVATCPGGWQTVPATPAEGAQ